MAARALRRATQQAAASPPPCSSRRTTYDGRAFDLMFAIADVLEADHGWSTEQSGAWLERMGLWEEEV